MTRVVGAWFVTKKGKLRPCAMKRVAAGAHLPVPWLVETAKRPDDRADYCLGCSFRPQCKHQVFVFTLEWGAPYGRKMVRPRPNEQTGPPGNAD